MRYSSLKKTLLHLGMHISAVLALFLIADILFCSYISVPFISGDRRYAMDSFRIKQDDTEDTITDIFAGQAADIMRYTAACELLGARGQINVNRDVDISKYYKGENRISIHFTIAELINMGRRGIVYSDRNLSITDFVYYYGDPIFAENFALDENGSLYFKGFEQIDNSRKSEYYFLINGGQVGGENSEDVIEAINNTAPADLMHLVIDYLIRKYPDLISLSYFDDGMVNVTFKEPISENETFSHWDLLRKSAENWDDYFTIVNELKEASVLYSSAYDVYREGSRIYDKENTNLIYCIKTKSDYLYEKVYTNDRELPSDDTDLTEFFSGHQYYLICYYDELEYSTLTDIPESVVTDIIRIYPEIYPNNTHIWMCLDDSFSRGEDVFYDVIYRYDFIRQFSRFLKLVIILTALVWIVIFVYLLFSTGVRENDGRDEYLIYPQDRLWTEVIITLVFIFFNVLKLYAVYLQVLVGENYCSISVDNGGPFRNAAVSAYLAFAGFGLGLSLSLDFIVFSIVRRIRAGILYKYSLMHTIKRVFDWFALNLSGGSKATVTVLIPYLFFLTCNCGGVALGIHFLETNFPLSMVIFLLLLIMDIYSGITLFLNTAEKKELLNGIARIRSGESDYKIDVENLRAENRDLAESINNIGEGIKTAVDASLMEEQLRTELITNVSHDLKTPITSIINYSDILSSRELSEEQKKEYLSIISDKSRRLKKLLEDLLEASKLSSGRVELNKSRTDLSELLIQALGEYEDRFSMKELEVIRNEFPRVFIYADAGSIWRIFDNLFENICKYAMNGTRIYVDFEAADGRAVIRIKNVSSVRPRFQGNELTERFIRGDESRSGDGTGLGLFIAKSLTEAHGGRFEIIVDGDMFTSVMDMPEFSSDIS